MAYKITELFHAKKRCNQLDTLGIRACSDARKRINPVLLDKAEAVGIRVCNHFNFAGLMIDCTERRFLKALGMDVHEVGACCYTFQSCFLYVS